MIFPDRLHWTVSRYRWCRIGASQVLSVGAAAPRFRDLPGAPRSAMAENGNLEARIVYRDRRPGSILTGRAFSASTGTERLLKAGGWPSIVGTYAFGVVGVAALAKVIPLRIEFEQIVGATPAEYAWLIALLGVPAALLAAVIGAFQAVRLVEGLALVGIFTAGPALLMATTAGQRRIAAMTFWSTYTPTGFSLGLLLGGLFAGTPSWRLTFVCHGALMVFVALMALGLPRLPEARRCAE